ncbi:hypothetical protein DMJ13_27340 [halophilic archaeon]|nr:hypothetical protein DMJ13_27340 [halophilic archaeon]
MFQKRPYRRLTILVLGVLVATAGATALGAAQSPPDGGSANNSTETLDHHWYDASGGQAAAAPASGNNSTTNGSSSGSNSGNSGDGGLFSGGLVPSINPADMAKGQMKAVTDILLGIGAGIANTVRDSVASIPAPGQPGDWRTWMNPQNGQWPGIQDATNKTMAIGSTILLMAFGMSFYKSDVYEQRQAWKRVGIGFVMVTLTWVIPPLILHGANEVAMTIVPDGHEFLQTPGNAEKLGVSLGFAAAVGVLQTGTVAVGLLVLGLERALVYLTVFMWPIAWGCRAHSGFVKSIGDTFVYLFGVVIVTKLFQAFGLAALSELNWASGFAGALESLAILLGGLIFLLLLFPRSMLSHANDAASVALGTSASNQRKAGRYVEEAGSRVGHGVHEKYKDYRSSDDDGDDGTNWEQPDGSTFGVGSSGSGSGSNSDSGTSSASSGSPSSVAVDGGDGIDAREVRDEDRERADYEMDRGLH